MEKTTQIFSEKDVFFKKFECEYDILFAFKPDNWGVFLKGQEKCINAPKVYLADIAGHYGEETAKELVRQQFVGLQQLGSSQNSKGIKIAADLFLSLYGEQITPYGLMLYFGLYPTKFKDTFREFDTQDILKQCAKFISWWQSRQNQEQEQQQETSENGISLEECLLLWVHEGRSDEDIRSGGLYHMGRITESMMKKARNYASKNW